MFAEVGSLEWNVYMALIHLFFFFKPVSAQFDSPPGEHTTPNTDAMADAEAGGGSGSERRTTAAGAGPTPVPLPTHRDPPPSLRRRLWSRLRSPFSWRRQGASSPLSSNPLPPTSQPTTLSGEDSSSAGQQLEKQNALPSCTRHDDRRLQVTVLVAMPDPRRPHPDGMAFTELAKGKKARCLDLDCDEDDLPDMVLGMTELHCTDTITTPKSP